MMLLLQTSLIRYLLANGKLKTHNCKHLWTDKSIGISHTCRKKKCWFNYSQPPLRTREILHPLGSDIPPHRMKQHKGTWKTIRKQLYDLKEGESITFGELLVKLKISESDYRLAVRSALNSPTVFVKWEPNKLRVKNYNPTCLKAWGANMDIQFVLDVYACAMYIVPYISKAQKGMSEQGKDILCLSDRRWRNSWCRNCFILSFMQNM